MGAIKYYKSMNKQEYLFDFPDLQMNISVKLDENVNNSRIE